MNNKVYKYGIDITNATLQTYAYGLGLTKSVSEMTQMEKMQLRLIAILDQSKVSWGDLANTINSPSNMMRQFSNNAKELGLVFGQLLIPALQKVMPVLNGATIALKRLLVSLANLLGIKLQLDDFGQGFTELEEDTDGLADSLDGVSKSAKKAYMGLLGFDKLNVIKTPEETPKTGNGGVGGGTIDLTEEIIKATEEYEEKFAKALEEMENKAQTFANKIEEIFKPITDPFKDMINNLKLGGWTQAGMYAGDTVSAIFDTISETLKNVDWDEVGKNIALFLKGINWWDVFRAVGNFFITLWDSAVKLWKSAFDAAPTETAIATVLAGLKISGVKVPISFTFGKNISSIFKTGALSSFILGGLGTASFDVIGYEIYSKLSDALEKLLPDWVFNWLSNVGAGIVAGAVAGSWFPGAGTLVGALIGGLIGALEGTQTEEGTSLLDMILEKFFNFDAAAELWENAKEAFATAFDGYRADWFDMGSWIVEGILDGILAAITFIFEPAADLLQWIVEGICNVFGIHSPAEAMKPLGENILLGIVEGFVSMFSEFDNAIANFWNDIVLPWVEKISSALTFDFDFGTENKKIPKIGVRAYSVGGFPKEDGLFMANHTELVGKFSNGKTAVANNEQITDGIRQAAYLGVKQAMAESGGSANVTFQVEGDPNRIFRVVRKEADSFLERTGRSPF